MRTPDKILVLVSVIGLLTFILVVPYFPFRDTLFSKIYPKPRSYAASDLKIPHVDLKIVEHRTELDGVVNSENPRQYTLFWKTEGNPKACIGRVWGIYDQDESWVGPKDVNSGSFTTKILDKKNPYVYSIDCQNDEGDAFGDSVTINIGAGKNDQKLYLTQFELNSKSQNSEGLINLTLLKQSQVNVSWSLLNSKTAYSVCVSTGSFPAGFKNLGSSTITETFQLDLAKVYTYTIYCSNESSYIQNSAVIIIK